MKRFLILLLALLLTVGMIACGGKRENTPAPEQPSETETTAAPVGETATAEPADEPVSEPEPEPAFAPGKYVLTAYQVGETTIEGELLTASGMDQSALTLNADHTGTLLLLQDSYEIGWTDGGDVTFSGVPLYTMTQADDLTITFNMGDAIMTFRPEDGASAGTVVEATAEPETPAETEAPNETEAPVVTEAPAANPQNTANGAPYGSSDGVVDHAKLAGLYRWMHEMPSEFLYALTFDEIGAAVSKQGADNHDDDGSTHSANWWDDDNHSITVTFKDKGNGVWMCNAIVTTLSSSEYNEADISGFPKIASSTPAGTNPTEKQTLETKVGFSGPKVSVTVDLPTKNWYPDAGSSSIYIYCAPNAERADRSSSYFKIECKESLEKINFYQDKFENLAEIEPCTIGGIEMQGRTYKYIGMNWIEYYGEVAEGVWVSVKLSGCDLSAGTETEAILMSMTFAVQ